MFTLIGDIYSFLFCRKIFYRLNRFLFALALRGMGCDNHKTLTESGEKRFIEKYILPLKNPVCFDVGANIGDFSKILADYLPEAQIHTFEPHPNTFKKCEENLKDYKNIKVNPFALSSCEGTAKLWDYNTEDGTSHASLTKESLIRSDTEKVLEVEIKMSTLDKYVEDNEIKKIDFLKIDVEGHEVDVLKGAEKTLRNGIIEIIQFEFTQANPSCGVFVKSFYDILADHYNIFRILRDDIIPLNEYNPTYHELMIFQNLVAIKK